jgi:hypothetical protein
MAGGIEVKGQQRSEGEPKTGDGKNPLDADQFAVNLFRWQHAPEVVQQ